MQLAVNIVVLASIYALIACGYVLIYRVSRVLNLAHGELMMLGAYMVLTTASLFDGHPVMALAAAILLSLLVGALVYVFLMRRMTAISSCLCIRSREKSPASRSTISTAFWSWIMPCGRWDSRART